MAESAIDYLTIGHLAKDLTPAGPQIGGTVSFASLTARALGYTPGILTAFGEGLDLSPLAGIPIVRVPSADSATFENIYGPGGRTQLDRDGVRGESAGASLRAARCSAAAESRTCCIAQTMLKLVAVDEPFLTCRRSPGYDTP